MISRNCVVGGLPQVVTCLSSALRDLGRGFWSVPCPFVLRGARLLIPLLVLWGVLLAVLPAETHAQEPVSPKDLRELIDRLSRVEKELAELKKQKPGEVPADPKEQRLVLLMEDPFLGNAYYGSPQGNRFFVGKLLMINFTKETIKLKRDDFKLKVDQDSLPIVDVPKNIEYMSFQTGRQPIQMRSVTPVQQVQIAPGGTMSTWVFFTDLPQGGNVPQLALSVDLNGTPQTLDISAAQRNLLDLKIERVGPQGALAFFRIGGELNSINVGQFVDELDKLGPLKVGRVVVSWEETATPMDSQLWGWLQNSAMMAGRGEVGQTPFPVIPATIRELHLARVPGSEGRQTSYGNNTPNRIHKTDAEAVQAALKTAFELLPRDELVTAIEQGHVLTRAAALATAGGRLDSNKLPKILELADDPELALQNAALTALQHFGEPEAVAKLVHYVKKNVATLSDTAIASLAGSRYAGAHQALLEVLQNEPPESKKKIVAVLSEYPRPIWSDVIYEYAQDPRSGLNLEALRALQVIGHPELVGVLRASLKSSDQPLKQLAFTILVGRTDQESENIAMEYTLEAMKAGIPDQNMLNLLNRVKDQRAVPLLLGHLDKTDNRTQILQTLTMIGDQELAVTLLERYEKFQPRDKALVLVALQKWKSPKFLELAKEALVSNDSSLINSATQGLIEDAGAAAVTILVDSLEKTPQQQAWHYICNALAQIGTPPARAALIKARDSGDKQKQQYANNALTQLRQRSPGYQHIYQGQAFAQQKRYKDALEHYSMAIQLDPELPEGYVGRADCLIRDEKFEEAGKDYAKALELDEFNSQALTGVCIVMAVDGKFAEAVTKLEASREKFPNNALFLYNSACVYGRALAKIQADEKIADREKLLAEYTKKAVRDLKEAKKYGFNDINWMKKDPDLKALHEDPEFQKLHGGQEGADEGDDAEDVQQEAPVEAIPF